MQSSGFALTNFNPALLHGYAHLLAQFAIATDATTKSDSFGANFARSAQSFLDKNVDDGPLERSAEIIHHAVIPSGSEGPHDVFSRFREIPRVRSG